MSKQSTATDIAVGNNISDGNFTNKDLDANIVRLMLEEPFYAGVLRGVSYIESESIPTAGVSTANCEVTMFWNRFFLASLERDQVKGLLKHEAMHLALDHTTDRGMDPHIVHNYATDLAINSDIPENELPEGGLIPGKAFKKLTPEQEITKRKGELAICWWLRTWFCNDKPG